MVVSLKHVVLVLGLLVVTSSTARAEEPLTALRALKLEIAQLPASKIEAPLSERKEISKLYQAKLEALTEDIDYEALAQSTANDQQNFSYLVKNINCYLNMLATQADLEAPARCL